jgi:Activator of Hsp90 ATPase homolog 1-like protein
MTLEHSGVTIADPAPSSSNPSPIAGWPTPGTPSRRSGRRPTTSADEFLATVAAERRSKVTFDIEALGELVKLTMVHDDFEPGSAVLESITHGWPVILASLKTLLETGETLPV